MKLEKISKEQEKKLIHSVEDVIDLVKKAGLSPTDALVKAAKEADLGPEETRRVAEAYNVSKSLAHQREKKGEARCEPFDLAHADLALKQLYPDTYKTQGQEKSASIFKARANLDTRREAINYIDKMAATEKLSNKQFVELTKTASDTTVVPDSDQLAHKMAKIASKKRLEIASIKQARGDLKIQLVDKLSKAASAIRENLETMPFDRLENALIQKYDSCGKSLANLLWPLSKAASFKAVRAKEYSPVIVDYTAEPFKSIDDFVKVSGDYRDMSLKLAEASKDKDLDWQARFFDKAGAFDKTKKLLSSLNLAPAISDDPAYQRELASTLGKINDPKYNNTLRRIRVKSMLMDIIANDPTIQSYVKQDPGNLEHLLQIYNDFAAMAPEAAENPSITRTYLNHATTSAALDYGLFQAAQGMSSGIRDNRAPRTENLYALASADPSSVMKQQNPDVFSRKGVKGTTGAISAILGGAPHGYADPRTNIEYERAKNEAARVHSDVDRYKKDQNLARERFEYEKERDLARINNEAVTNNVLNALNRTNLASNVTAIQSAQGLPNLAATKKHVDDITKTFENPI